MGACYDGEEYRYFEDLGELVTHMLQNQYAGMRWYALYGGKFDWNLVLDHIHTRMGDYRFSVVFQGSKAILITVTRGSRRWYLVDSSALFPGMSLGKLTESFGVRYKKMLGTIDFAGGERVDKSKPLHRQYLKHDVLGHQEVLDQFAELPEVKKVGVQLTVASQAMAMFRSTMRHAVRCNPAEVTSFVRAGYFGGRVEIYKMEGRDLAYYDANSLFPFCMRSFPLPLQFRRWRRSLDGCPEGSAFVDCEVESPGMYIPVLPVRHEDKLIFPNGRFRGVFFSEELRLAVARGYRILKVHRVAEFYVSKTFFSEYVDRFYAMKREAPKGSSTELLAKLALNSLYGKFGQRPNREVLKVRDGTEKRFQPFHSAETYERTGLIVVQKDYEATYILPQIAAAVTAWSRVHMVRSALGAFPQECWYTDTDSVLTSRRLDTGKELGEMKLEKDGFDGVFLRPKGYDLRKNFAAPYTGEAPWLTAKGVSVDRKLKGFPTSFVRSLSNEQFDAMDFEYRKEVLSTMKRSLTTTGRFLSRVEVVKTVRGTYTKRRMLPQSFETEPWELRGGTVMQSV